MRYGIIKDDIIINIIIAPNQATADAIATQENAVARDLSGASPQPGPGWTDNGDGTYSPPTVSARRWIGSAAFLSRFTDGELGQLQALANSNATVRGWTWWLDRQVAVDLDDSRITDRLQQAVDGAFLTQQRMDEILA